MKNTLAYRPWAIPALLGASFAIGIGWSLVPALPAFIGAAFASVPAWACAVKLLRSRPLDR